MKLYEWLPYSYGTDVEYIMYGENSLSSEVSDIKIRVKFKLTTAVRFYSIVSAITSKDGWAVIQEFNVFSLSS